MREQITKPLLLAMLLSAAIASQAVASPATGTNPDLTATGGKIFIPLKPSTSGVFGVGNIGKVSDNVALSGNGATSSGWVSLVLAFDFSGDVTPGNTIVTGGSIQLTFKDLDFKTVIDPNRFSYREWLELSFQADAGGPVVPGSPLVIDGSNYADFIPGHNPVDPPPTTNRAVLTYEFDLKGDLHVTQTELDNLTADHEFGLLLTFHSGLVHLRTTSDRVYNTAEDLGNNFAAFLTPEPGTMVLLTCGAIGLLTRKLR